MSSTEVQHSHTSRPDSFSCYPNCFSCCSYSFAWQCNCHIECIIECSSWLNVSIALWANLGKTHTARACSLPVKSVQWWRKVLKVWFDAICEDLWILHVLHTHVVHVVLVKFPHTPHTRREGAEQASAQQYPYPRYPAALAIMACSNQTCVIAHPQQTTLLTQHTKKYEPGFPSSEKYAIKRFRHQGTYLWVSR